MPLDDVFVRPVARPPVRSGALVAFVAVAVAAAAVVAVVVATLGDVDGDDPPATTIPTTAVRELSTGLFAYDFDGDGGNCFRIAEPDAVATGCATGEQLRSARPLIAATSPTSWSLVTPSPVARTADLAGCLVDVTEPVLIDPVVCAPRPLTGVLPASTWGTVEWSLRDVEGRRVALQPLESVDGGTLFFGIPDSSCRIFATWGGGGDWSEACVPKFAAALTVIDGRPAEVSGTGVVALTGDEVERLGCVDVAKLLQLAAARGGVTTDLQCTGDGAELVQGSAELETGRAEPLTLHAQHTAAGWTLID